jgi:ADP-heptose:LPS heptosyltransferase
MILVLRALGVGDLATAVPALRGLRAAFPDRTLALAAPGWLAPLVELVGGVDRLVPVAGLDPVPGPMPTGWPDHGPEWGVNLHGRGPGSHRLLRSAGSRRLGAYRCSQAGHADGPEWDDDEHEVFRWCRLLAWYGMSADPADLDLRRPAPDRVPVGVTIVHPGGKEPRRRWPLRRFAAVARRLARCGHRILITGSAAERELAEQVAACAGLPGPAVLAGRLDLAGLAALVAHARVVVSADTGVAHLATAYGTPSVVLFGPERPRRWGPPADRPWHRVLWSPRLATAPPGSALSAMSEVHPALAAIGVRRVLTAVGEAEQAGRDRDAAAAQ